MLLKLIFKNTWKTVKLGESLAEFYKKTIKTWEKFAQDKINGIEKKIMAAEAVVEKAKALLG